MGRREGRVAAGQEPALLCTDGSSLPGASCQHARDDDVAACLAPCFCLSQEHVIGQDEAITSTARAMVRAQGGLKDPRRPIAALMFSGPTGVGKTELTKVRSSTERGRWASTAHPPAAACGAPTANWRPRVCGRLLCCPQLLPLPFPNPLFFTPATTPALRCCLSTTLAPSPA